jgi:hypothetical protein
LDIELFREKIQAIKLGPSSDRQKRIEELLQIDGLTMFYQNKYTKCHVITCETKFDYIHEYHTAIKLTGEYYHVLFVPKGYFSRTEKKFDVFIAKAHIFLESDLKRVISVNPDTIGKRIREGSEQSERVILDVHSNISKKALIDGLKLGCNRNKALVEVMLFYNSQFYRLSKSKILSKKIFNIIK